MPNAMTLKDLSAFDGTIHRPLPPGSLRAPRHHVVYNIVLEKDTTTGELTARFNSVLIGQGEQPLAINIFCDAKICLDLDQSGGCDWEFDPDEGITLAYLKPADPCQERYFNFATKQMGDLGRLQRATFDARHIGTGSNPDKYNVKVLIHRGPDGTVYIPALEKFIDPDIKNPGSYGILTPI